MNNKKIVLIFISHYLPGYKSGGPLRTIVNMVEHLSDEFQFCIVNKDRDLGDSSAYSEIKPNEWQPVGKAMVYYLSPDSCTMKNIFKLISTTPHDLVYLNSFFDSFGTIRPLIARRLGRLPFKPVVLAPRGEFSAGALKLKALKKLIYIKIARLLRLYRDVLWQASSEYEVQDIKRGMVVDVADIHIATDLPTMVTVETHSSPVLLGNCDEHCLRIVFLSRISPMKNLDYALQVLRQVKSTVIFDIYGPSEDAQYWRQCQNLIKQLPNNISVTYKGSVAADHVRSVFRNYDLFFFPTRGENYGHVIAESLSVGTPILISDQTPWRNLWADNMGWDLPLDKKEEFAHIIDDYSLMVSSDRFELRKNIKEKIVQRLTDPLVFEANRELFRKALQKKIIGGLVDVHR